MLILNGSVMSSAGSTPIASSRQNVYGTQTSYLEPGSRRELITWPTPPLPEDPPPPVNSRCYKVLNGIVLAAGASVIPLCGAGIFMHGGNLYKGLAIAIWLVSLACLLLGARNILKIRAEEQASYPTPA